MFNQEHRRFATYGVVSVLPGEIIDTLWAIIDEDLQGVVDLDHTIEFDFHNRDGHLSVSFGNAEQDGSMAIEFDLPVAYDRSFPDNVVAFDDGTNQTIMLMSELKEL